MPRDLMTSAAPLSSVRLSVQGLHHRFGTRVVLDGLDFEIRRGEIFGLLGPNGCGKSTTIQILLGLIEQTRGAVTLDGAAISAKDTKWRRNLGVVFQSPSLDARLSARENLRLSARLYGVAAKEIEPRIEELLTFLELRDRGDEVVLKWSGGMKRRLELGRALLHRPALLFLDEPTSGLDEHSFRRTWARIDELKVREQLTVLLTTHRPEEADHCDRVLVMHRGKAVAAGTPDELRARVSGDVIVLAADDPERLVQEIETALSIQAKVVGSEVHIEHARAHELVPRLVESLPKGRLKSLSMRRPSLADVFVKLTGESLTTDNEAS